MVRVFFFFFSAFFSHLFLFLGGGGGRWAPGRTACMTQRKGEKPTISIQEHMAIDVCPGPIQPIKQISDYFPRYPRGLPPAVAPPAGRSGSLCSALSSSSPAAPESERPDEEKPERACAGAAAAAPSSSSQSSRKDEEPDVEGYDSDDSSESPFSSSSPHLHVFVCFCQRLPGVPSAICFYLSPFLPSISPTSPSLPPFLSSPLTPSPPLLGVEVHVAANSSHLSHQTANCCCSTQLPPPSSSTSSSFCSSCCPSLFEKITCLVLLEQMILCLCVCVCAAFFPCLRGPRSHRAVKRFLPLAEALNESE